jgi:hypothetical protein
MGNSQINWRVLLTQGGDLTPNNSIPEICLHSPEFAHSGVRSAGLVPAQPPVTATRLVQEKPATIWTLARSHRAAFLSRRQQLGG